MQKRLIRIAIVVGLILLIPLVMMIIGVEGWHWTLSDFIVMGLLLFSTGVSIDFVARKITNITHRFFAIIFIVAIFFIIWAGMVANIWERLFEKLFCGTAC